MRCLPFPRLRAGHSRLVLSRRPGDILDIGGNVSVTVVSVSGRSVRLAIDAPRSLPIYRRELKVLDLEGNRHE